MARMTKAEKMQRNINRLATEFNVPSVPVRIASAGYMTSGLYHRMKTVFTCPAGPGTRPVATGVEVNPFITLDHKLT